MTARGAPHGDMEDAVHNDPGRLPLQGAFVTFEGVDGCGKTVQAHRLAERLRKHGAAVLETREPGGTPIGAQIRKVLLDVRHEEMEPLCELLLMLADRVQHVRQQIRPALDEGATVICDRFHDATWAYQHHARGLDLTPVAALIDAEITPALPHLTLWLDVDVREAQRRIEGRKAAAYGKFGAYADTLVADEMAHYDLESRLEREGLGFQQRVREGYALLHERFPQRIRRIDASASEDEVAAQIWQVMRERFEVDG